MTTKHYFDRICRVEREYGVVALSVALLHEKIRVDSVVLDRNGFSIGDLERCREKLEFTYLLRLFSEFEAGVRGNWEIVRRRSSRPKMEDLVDRIAAYQNVSVDALCHVHEVREYRNNIIHDLPPVQVFTFGECRSRLCKFLSFLPHDWS